MSLLSDRTAPKFPVGTVAVLLPVCTVLLLSSSTFPSRETCNKVIKKHWTLDDDSRKMMAAYQIKSKVIQVRHFQILPKSRNHLVMTMPDNEHQMTL